MELVFLLRFFGVCLLFSLGTSLPLTKTAYKNPYPHDWADAQLSTTGTGAAVDSAPRYDPNAVDSSSGTEALPGGPPGTKSLPVAPPYVGLEVSSPSKTGYMAYHSPGGSAPQDERTAGGAPEWLNWRPLPGPGTWQPLYKSPDAPSYYIIQSKNGYLRARAVMSRSKYSPNVPIPVDSSHEAASDPKPSQPVSGSKGQSY